MRLGERVGGNGGAALLELRDLVIRLRSEKKKKRMLLLDAL